VMSYQQPGGTPMNRTAARSIVTVDATAEQVDRSIARHVTSNGLDAEHYGRTVGGCVGCARRNAVTAVASIRREGADRHAVVYRHGNEFVALDLDEPFASIVDDLYDLGLDSNAAEDEAWRLVQ
ncbi:MAG: hypothetical protein ABR616_07725, partial [Dermatophilaceae bacterium]